MELTLKMHDLKEDLLRRYSVNGIKTKLSERSLVEDEHYEFDLTFFKNTNTLAELSIGLNFLKRIGSIYDLEIQESIRGRSYETQIVLGLENTLKQFNFEQIRLIARDPYSEMFWKKMKYRPSLIGMIKFL